MRKGLHYSAESLLKDPEFLPAYVRPKQGERKRTKKEHYKRSAARYKALYEDLKKKNRELSRALAKLGKPIRFPRTKPIRFPRTRKAVRNA